MRELERDASRIEVSLGFRTDEQKANGKAIICLGYDGHMVAHAIDLRRAKSCNVTKMPKGDYSAKQATSLIKIKTLAVNEAVATDPDLEFDLLLQTLLVQLVHGGYSLSAIRALDGHVKQCLFDYSLPLKLMPMAASRGEG